MIRGGRSSLLMLYMLLVLLFAPMVALGGLWAWMTLSGLFRAPDIADLRTVGLMWMVILMAGAAICVFAELLFVPFVIGLTKLRRSWMTAPISLIAGLFAGAAAYVFFGGGAEPLSDAMATGPVLFAHGAPNWPVIAPLASALTFALAAGATAWILRPRREAA